MPYIDWSQYFGIEASPYIEEVDSLVLIRTSLEVMQLLLIVASFQTSHGLVLSVQQVKLIALVRLSTLHQTRHEEKPSPRGRVRLLSSAVGTQNHC